MADLNSMLYDIKRIEQHRVELTDEKIKAIYEQLESDLNSFLASSYRKYADGDGRLYMNYLDENRQRAAFLQEIVNNVDNISPALKEQMQNLINEVYTECFEGMYACVKDAYADGELAAVVQDIDVRPEVLNQYVENNISKLTLPAVLEAHRAQVIYQIQRELTIGLMNGDRYETMANRISDRLGVSKGKAMNITRTETHRNVEGGFMECAEHIQQGMEGSDYIYAATWRNMGDEKVRPQRRYKTKSGWKTKIDKKAANHVVLEGQTVKVGEMFDLGVHNGQRVRAKAPSMSGVAAHDCNCRCFLEYNLMTVEEFAKATKQTPEQVRKKYNMKEPEN